ncbi:lytic transglycosylase domain-containing protein [Desulfonema magnum]|nr:lytic transglycosylase domain-containing protein [Desulfonema magnum]
MTEKNSATDNSPHDAQDDPDISRFSSAEKKEMVALKKSSGSRPFNIFIYFKNMMGVMVLSCFFLSIPSVIHQISEPVPSERRVFGPFPILLSDSASASFPFPDNIRPQVDFWKKIFTVYTADHVVIHDNWYLNVVYEVIDIGGKNFLTRKDARIAVKAAREKYKQLLENLPWDAPENMTKEEQRVYSLFADITESPRFKKKDAKDRIHAQFGIADTFKAGLIRSGKYIDTMKQIFAKQGLPEDIVCLPMIESGFNPYAKSYVGASGMWQFMKRTGKEYDLIISGVVDERRDPLLSTQAAARFLKNNYNILGSWPLAITSYNHGLQGMKNAVKQVGSEHIEDIIEQYESRSFQFASRNFYPEFLAAREIVTQHTKYFKDIELDESLEIIRLELPDYVTMKTLEEYCQITASDIKKLNPALDRSVFSHNTFIPKGYQLNVLADQKDLLALGYKTIPDNLKYQYILHQKKHRVRRGQTLSAIARAHKTSVKAFMRLNGIRNPKRIRIGQWLKIPGKYISANGKEAPKLKKQTRRKKSLVKSRRKRHRVKRGQTLIRIAKLYNTSPRAIIKLNSLKNPQKIRAGQLLRIPGG